MSEDRAAKEKRLGEMVEVTLFNNEKPQEAIIGKVNNFSFSYPHGSKVKVPLYILDFLKTLKYRKWEENGSEYVQMDSISIHYHEDKHARRSDRSNNPVRGLLEMNPIPNTFTQEEAIAKIMEGMGLKATPEAVQAFINQLKGKAGQLSQPMEPGAPTPGTEGLPEGGENPVRMPGDPKMEEAMNGENTPEEDGFPSGPPEPTEPQESGNEGGESTPEEDKTIEFIEKNFLKE